MYDCTSALCRTFEKGTPYHFGKFWYALTNCSFNNNSDIVLIAMDIHLQIKSRNFPKQSNVQVVSFVMPPIQLVMNAYLCASFETRNKLSSFRKILNVLLCTMNLMHWKLASGKQKRTMPNRDAFLTTKFGLFPDHFLKENHQK